MGTQGVEILEGGNGFRSTADIRVPNTTERFENTVPSRSLAQRSTERAMTEREVARGKWESGVV